MISERKAEELYALRGVLEGYAAHEFAKNGSDEVIAEFCQTVRVLRKAELLARQNDICCMILCSLTAETT